MRLDDITPVILTCNEEPNIGRTLNQLAWAKDIVVVDSGSTDGTHEILKNTPNVRIFEHTFANHSDQWTYAIQRTGILTRWVLVLDADLLLSKEFVEEMVRQNPTEEVTGYEVRFQICVHGRPLPHSIYPPRIVLCRRDRVTFYQDGHTQRLVVSGSVGRMQASIGHDDRKSITHWLKAQDNYARLERDKLLAANPRHLDRADRIRTLRVVAPIVVLVYCLFFKGLILKGIPGWYYTYQRVVAELVLCLYLIEDRLKHLDPPP